MRCFCNRLLFKVIFIIIVSTILVTRYFLLSNDLLPIKSNALCYFLLQKVILLRNALPPTLSITAVT